MSRVLVVAAVLPALAALTAFACGHADSQQSTAQPRSFFLTSSREDRAWPPEVEEAEHVSTLEDVRAAAPSPALIFIDAGTADALEDGSLREFVARGYALVGLNVPLHQLRALSGFVEEISSINPEFGKHDLGDATFVGDYFTVVWR